MDATTGSAGARIRHDRYFGPEREAEWARVVPFSVAVEQVLWERGAWVVRARNAGITLSELGDIMGLGKERVRQIEARHRRCYERGRNAGRLSPVEAYLEDRIDVVRLFADIRAQQLQQRRMAMQGKPYRPIPNPPHRPILSD